MCSAVARCRFLSSQSGTTDLHREGTAGQVRPAAGELQPVETGAARVVGASKSTARGFPDGHWAVGTRPVRKGHVQGERGSQPLAVAAAQAWQTTCSAATGQDCSAAVILQGMIASAPLRNSYKARHSASPLGYGHPREVMDAKYTDQMTS